MVPGIAAALAPPVHALLYVDAGLPHPGQSWWQTAPPELTVHLTTLAVDGQLPPWPEWFPPEVLTELLPDPQLRARFLAEPVSLPMAYFIWRY